MALFGKRDSYAATGTVTFETGNTTIVGSGTAFTTEVKVGDAIFLSSANTAPGTTTRYKVIGIANTTSLTIETGYLAANAAGATMNVQESPTNLPTTYAGKSLANKRDIIGVDVTEARLAANRARGLHTPGWVNYVAGTGGRAGRKNVETLVAMRSMTATAASDAADDSVAADS